jgi:hypothetical protein
VKKLLVTVLAMSATVVVAGYVIKKLNEVLETFQEDETEDLPEGVEGYDPTWTPNLPPAVQKVLDEALARFPEGWTKRDRPQRKTESSEEDPWGHATADQASA